MLKLNEQHFYLFDQIQTSQTGYMKYCDLLPLSLVFSDLGNLGLGHLSSSHLFSVFRGEKEGARLGQRDLSDEVQEVVNARLALQRVRQEPDVAAVVVFGRIFEEAGAATRFSNS